MTPTELKARRKALGLTAVQLAALAGVHPSYVHYAETGVPPRIAAALERAETTPSTS
jgi:predicted transcriptional regulator